jgi:tRNA pseudouridine32 synthase / 23S rRNA pseudouridine746 synthase
MVNFISYFQGVMDLPVKFSNLIWAYFLLGWGKTVFFESQRKSFPSHSPMAISIWEFLLYNLLYSKSALLINSLDSWRCSLSSRRYPTHRSMKENTISSFEILYESDRVLAICKPEGISYHDDDQIGSGILSLLRKHQSDGRITYSGRLYGVHRLDQVTSGILLMAKDSTTAGELSAQFREGKVTKYYCGLSAKKPSTKKQGWIQGNMVKSRRKSWMLTPYSKEVNKENYARTRFFSSSLSFLQDQLEDPERIHPRTLLLFRPYTGRTHQLRVAAKSVGLPLLGDPIYKDGSPLSTEDIHTVRTFLHACGLHLTLNDEPISIWSPPPFESVWDSTGTHQFKQVFHALCEKNIDCEAILEALNLSNPPALPDPT